VAAEAVVVAVVVAEVAEVQEGTAKPVKVEGVQAASIVKVLVAVVEKTVVVEVRVLVTISFCKAMILGLFSGVTLSDLPHGL